MKREQIEAVLDAASDVMRLWGGDFIHAIEDGVVFERFVDEVEGALDKRFKCTAGDKGCGETPCICR